MRMSLNRLTNYFDSISLVFTCFLILSIERIILLWNNEWNEENYSHGPIILFISIYLFHKSYKKLNSVNDVNNRLLSYVLIAISSVFVIVGRSQNISSIDVLGLILILTSFVFYVKGYKGIKAVAFPLFFLLFIIPIPGAILDPMTRGLKEFASLVSTEFLFLIGYPIARTGVSIVIGQYQLLVADACSGMNSIFSLSAISLLYINAIAIKNKYKNILLVLFILPIAIVTNIARICILVLLTYYYGNEVGQGFAHNLAGLFMFMIAIVSFFILDNTLMLIGKLKNE